MAEQTSVSSSDEQTSQTIEKLQEYVDTIGKPAEIKVGLLEKEITMQGSLLEESIQRENDLKSANSKLSERIDQMTNEMAVLTEQARVNQSVDKENESHLKTIESLQNDLKSAIQDRDSFRDQNGQLSSTIDDLQRQMKELNDSNENLNLKLSESQKSVDMLGMKLDESFKEFNAVLRALEEARETISQMIEEQKANEKSNDDDDDDDGFPVRPHTLVLPDRTLSNISSSISSARVFSSEFQAGKWSFAAPSSEDVLRGGQSGLLPVNTSAGTIFGGIPVGTSPQMAQSAPEPSGLKTIDDLNSRVLELEEQIDEMKLAAKEDAAVKDQTIQVLQDRCKESADQISRLSEQLTESHDQIKQLEDKLTDIGKSKETLESQVDILRQASTEMSDMIDSSSNQTDRIKKLESDLIEIQNDRNSLKEQLEKSLESSNECMERISLLQTENDSLKNSLSSIESEKMALEERLVESHKKNESLNHKYNAVLHENESMRSLQESTSFSMNSTKNKPNHFAQQTLQIGGITSFERSELMNTDSMISEDNKQPIGHAGGVPGVQSITFKIDPPAQSEEDPFKADLSLFGIGDGPASMTPDLLEMNSMIVKKDVDSLNVPGMSIESDEKMSDDDDENNDRFNHERVERLEREVVQLLGQVTDLKKQVKDKDKLNRELEDRISDFRDELRDAMSLQSPQSPHDDDPSIYPLLRNRDNSKQGLLDGDKKKKKKVDSQTTGAMLCKLFGVACVRTASNNTLP